VLSVTCLQAGAAYNVIPETAVLRGTARTFRRETMQLIEDNMRRMATSIAEGYGATAEVDFRFLFAPLVNNADETAAYGDAAAALVGEANVERNGPAVMGSEDFSFMLEACAGAYINIGNGPSAPVHNDRYDFNDAILPLGAAILAQLVEMKLSPDEL
jgi:hippurate hydrolase